MQAFFPDFQKKIKTQKNPQYFDQSQGNLAKTQAKFPKSPQNIQFFFEYVKFLLKKLDTVRFSAKKTFGLLFMKSVFRYEYSTTPVII